jgi:Ca-activated chloride channel family protein
MIAASMFTTTAVFADGIVIPSPPMCDPHPCPISITQLAIEYHHVEVTIEDQIATTHVDQVFRNDNDWQIEGTYIFPMPVDATIAEFVLWIEGEPVEAKVMTREEARRTYEEIVRTMRDPALLEYIDRGAIQASIFPIPPGGTRRIELEYSQVLTAENGLIHYSYPLNTEKFSTQPLEEVSVAVRTVSSTPIRAVYSPSHNVSLDRDGNFEFVMGYEDQFVTPDQDFELYYSIAEDEFGLNLISYRDPFGDDDDGFFLLLAAPSVEVDNRRSIPKDVIIVLDRSGSMEGEKFRQAQEAVRYILNHLNPEDHFNLVVFSTGTNSYAPSLRPAEEAAEALRWVDQLSAKGSTDINLALLEALAHADTERPSMILFLTDGVPTVGVTDSQSILRNISAASPGNVRLFSFGVGYDVDTFLLDSLAQENQGATTYVTPDQDIDESVSGFYGKVNDPVLTDIRLDFGDITVFDLYPEPLPDLFSGSQLVLVGRYKGSGIERISLSGEVSGEFQSFTYPRQRFVASGGQSFLPRLWATRKIGSLLNEVRLNGPVEELVDQIVRLSIRYGIITPYTSFLVTEPDSFGEDAQSSIAADAFENLMATPTMVTGQGAVERAAEEAAISGANVPAPLPTSAADMVRLAGPNTYRWMDGVWIDTRFDPVTMVPLQVPFLSEDYFSLAGSNDGIAAGLALGERVIVMMNGIAYEVIDMDGIANPITLPELPLVDNPEQGSDPVEPSLLSPDNEGENLFTCPGVAFALGMAMIPLRKRFWLWGDKRLGKDPANKS